MLLREHDAVVAVGWSLIKPHLIKTKLIAHKSCERKQKNEQKNKGFDINYKMIIINFRLLVKQKNKKKQKLLGNFILYFYILEN